VYENPQIKNLGTRLDYAKQAEAYFGNNVPATDDTAPDACPIDGPCNTSGIDGGLAALAAYIQTEKFKRGFLAYIAGNGI
jgi:hypothetical protein